MNELTELLTREQLDKRLRPSIPNGADADQVMAGVLLALTPPEERTRPIERGIGEPNVVYAWRESDASVTRVAFDVLKDLGQSVLLGPKGIAKLGVALKELVCFLIDLHRHRVRVVDPEEISVLLLLHKTPSGLTSRAIRQRLVEKHGREVAPSVPEVEKTLDRLANATAAAGPKPLVHADGQIWKSLV